MSSQATYAHFFLFRLNRLVIPCIEIRFGFKLFCIKHLEKSEILSPMLPVFYKSFGIDQFHLIF